MTIGVSRHERDAGRPVCSVTLARWRVWEDGLGLEVTGTTFVYHMVRNVVGTALAAARAGIPRRTWGAVLAHGTGAGVAASHPRRGCRSKGVRRGRGLS